MSMLNSIKKYLKKAREEAAREYTVPKATQDVQIDPETGEEIAAFQPAVWTGVDLDGTLAHWDHGSSIETIGEPVPAMMALVKKMVANGIRVKIFTARAQDPEQLPIIRKWLTENGLSDLEITNVKDYAMQRLYDDRCIQVERNSGRLIVDQ
jgi:hypothetical protein